MTGEIRSWSVRDWRGGYGLRHFFGCFGDVVEELVGCCDLFRLGLAGVGVG